MYNETPLNEKQSLKTRLNYFYYKLLRKRLAKVYVLYFRSVMYKSLPRLANKKKLVCSKLKPFLVKQLLEYFLECLLSISPFCLCRKKQKKIDLES